MAELSKAIARLMEQRERERARPDNGGREVRETPAPQLRSHVPAGDRSLAENFVRHFVETAAAEEVDDAELRLLAMIAFRFVVDRAPEEPRIRVFDPSVAQDGWESSGTVLQILLRNRPFIVETVRQCLADNGTPARRLFTPTFRVERDQRRAVVAIGAPTASGPNEIFIHAEVERLPQPHAVAELVRRHVREAMAAADDLPAMRERLRDVVDELEAKALPRPWNAETAETRAFLEWLGADNFLFLGYREYQLTGQGPQRTASTRQGSGLGLLHDTARSSFATPQRLSDPLRHRLNEPPLLMITKTNSETVVYRKARMDYVGIKDVDTTGVVVGERRFLGLFTPQMFAAESSSIPWLARKLEMVREGESVMAGSDEAEEIRAVFNSIPKTELFALNDADLAAEIAEIRAARGTGTLRVSSRVDAIGRGVLVLVIMPRDRFSADVRARVEERLVNVLQASAILDREVVTTDAGEVRLHFYCAASPENLRLLGAEDLLSEVADLMRSWDDRVRQALSERFPGRGRELAEKYGALLPRSYKDSTDVAQAVEDVRCLELLRKEQGAHVELIDLGAKAERRTLLRLYQIGETLALGELVAGLGNFGLRVLSVQKQEIGVPDLGVVYIYSFAVESAGGEPLDVADMSALVPRALLRLRAGLLENDALNALVLRAKLSWERVEVLRAYVNYCADAGLSPSREALAAALSKTPEAARLLWLYFESRFDPADRASAREREDRVLPAAEAEFRAALESIDNAADAAVLARLFSAVAATVRTNFFAPLPAGKTARAALALKLDGAKLPPLTGRRAAYELYVDGPSVRGMLLGDGATARAIIRPYGESDGLRAELTGCLPHEALGNFVSAPEAAAGGWAVARRGGSRVQADAALRTYLGAVLDLTDNVERGRITPPAGVVSYDGPAPFLSVAFDEPGGEAAKIANEVAEERRFWLGDAFAPGQQNAFEERRLSTAARGAWECAQWHLVEVGDEREGQTLTVVGVGDMSDVAFGGGLIASRRLRLLAAIGEQHLFLDPNPDVSKSFAERERLFNLPRSTWADFDRELLSPGGGVYSRTSTSIPLSDEVRRLLGFPLVQEVATPAEMVAAILAMDVDLLWLGGSGDVIRAASEMALPIGVGRLPGMPLAATDVRAKVVVEPRSGATTQRARIEYAQRGGYINTASIDAAAGVDLADHEVNFKLAIGAAFEGGHVTAAQRQQLLDEMKPQALAAVLARSLAHARAITLDQRRSQTQIDDFRQLAGHLLSEGLLPADSLLPDWELSAGRRGPLGGLSRPEVADLLAAAKRSLQRRILASDVPDDAFFEGYLRDYFPEALNVSCGQQIRSLKLRREIIAAELARLIVESMGVTFVGRICRETGGDTSAVVRAWAMVVETSGALALWDEVGNAEPPLPLRGELACWEALAYAIESGTRWVLQTQPPEATAGGVFDMYAEPARDLLKGLPRLLPAGQMARIHARVATLAREGIPRALPERIVPLASLADVLDIVEIAAEYGVDRETVTALYYEIGDLLDLDWVRDRIADLPADTRWERRARNSLIEGLLYVRKELTRRILLSRQEPTSVHAALEGYLVEHQERLTHLGELIDDITSAQRPSLAALMVIVREYGHLVERYA